MYTNIRQLREKYPFLGGKIRILNSAGEGKGYISCYPGSQILSTTIEIPLGKSLVLLPGDSFDKTNFASTRGAVVKRVIVDGVEQNIIVPSGYSIISKAELAEKVAQLPENKGRIIYVKNIGRDNVLINSNYCHPQTYESLYDPEIFTKTSFSWKYPRFLLSETDYIVADEESKTLYVDLQKVTKAENDQTIPLHIYKEGKNYKKIVFQNKESGYFVVQKTPVLSRFKLIIFDLDGTLYDSKTDKGKNFAEKDLELSYQYISRKTSIPVDVVQAKKKELGSVNETVTYYGKLFEFTLDDLYAEVHSQLSPEKYISINEAMITSLKGLKNKGFKLALASNNSILLMVKTMQALGLTNDLFDYVFCSQKMGISKPSKAFFQTILDQFNCKSAEVLSIGDSFNKDIVPALSLGISGLWVDGPEVLIKKLDLLLEEISPE